MEGTVQVRRIPSNSETIKDIENRIMQRAYHLFERNGHQLGRAMDDWFQAEKELVWKPPMEIVESDNEFIVEAALSGVDPKDIEIEATADNLVIKSETGHDHMNKKDTVHLCEFETGKMFRAIELPKRINPDKVRAEVKNGLLRVTADISNQARVRKIKPEAA